MALIRIAKEHTNLQRDPLETCSAGPAELDNPRRWIGHITGPPGTPYEQKTLPIAITFPEDYPMKPFQLAFTTPVSHPNVSEHGEVRLDELEEKHWSPVFTVRSILLCLQALLSSPESSQGAMNIETKKTSLNDNHPEHGVGSRAVKRQVEPTHHGRKIGGKKYAMDMSRPEFGEYENLPESEKNDFLMKHADIVWDV